MRSEAVGIGGIGLLFGVMVGLSASPITGAVLTAAISLGGIVLPILSKTDSVELWKNTSRALGPFSIAGLIGLLGGVTLRANDALDFRQTATQQENWRILYEKRGFTEGQVKIIMNRLASQVEFRTSGPIGGAREPTRTHLNETSPMTWTTFENLANGDKKKLIRLVCELGNRKDVVFVFERYAEGLTTDLVHEELRSMFRVREEKR